MTGVKRTVAKFALLASLLISCAGTGNAQNLDLWFSFCFPLTCASTNFTTFGSAFVEIDGTCFNGTKVGAFGQVTVIIPCTLPVLLKANAGESRTPQLDECGQLFTLGGVFATTEADNGSQVTGKSFAASYCDGGQTDPSPAYDPC